MMVDALTLTAASAALTAPTIHSATGEVSIVIIAKALSTIDILLAQHPQIALKDLAPTSTHPYAMELVPILVKTITGNPMVHIQAAGIGGEVHVSVKLQFTMEDRRTRSTFVAEHTLDDVHLSPQALTFIAALPESAFTAGSQTDCMPTVESPDRGTPRP